MKADSSIIFHDATCSHQVLGMLRKSLVEKQKALTHGKVVEELLSRGRLF